MSTIKPRILCNSLAKNFVRLTGEKYDVHIVAELYRTLECCEKKGKYAPSNEVTWFGQMKINESNWTQPDKSIYHPESVALLFTTIPQTFSKSEELSVNGVRPNILLPKNYFFGLDSKNLKRVVSTEKFIDVIAGQLYSDSSSMGGLIRCFNDGDFIRGYEFSMCDTDQISRLESEDFLTFGQEYELQ